MTTSTTTDPFAGKELWFLTGSQSLYGDDTLRQVADQAGQVVAALDAAPGIPVRIVPQPVLTTSDAIRRACLDATTDDRCIGVVAWMHTFSPAKMWIGGLQALGKPLLHLHTQANRALPWSSIDMDFMNLNQAAHGDREFGFVQTRMGVERTTVFGHVDDPEVQAAVGRWTRAATGWHTMRHLKLARFGDNMRDVAVTEGDKVEAEIRFGVSVNTWGVNDLVDAVDRGARRRRRRARHRVRRPLRHGRRPAPRRRSPRRRCGSPPASRPASGPSSPTAASAPSPPTSRTSAACASSPASACSA